VLPAELPDRVRNLPYNGAWDEGLKLYKISVENEVPDYRIWFKLGMVVFEGGHLEEALDCFRRLLDLESPSDYDFMALTWMGNVWDARGRREEAIKLYRQALKINPDGAWRHDQFGIESSQEWIENRLQTRYDWSTIIKK
jgi:tetratricopeptide (TPR) repeat protein